MNVLYAGLSRKNKMVLASQIEKDPTVVLDHPTMGLLETSISGAIFITSPNDHRAVILEALISH